MVRVTLIFMVVLSCFVIQGCSTPEGGSSLPWSQPESWETNPSLGMSY